MARDLRSSICAQLFPETETGSPLLLDPKLNGFGDGGGQLRTADGRLLQLPRRGASSHWRDDKVADCIGDRDASLLDLHLPRSLG